MIATSPAYHDHSPPRLLQNFPDTTAGTAPLLVIQGLDDEAAPPANGHALREQLGARVRVVDLPRAGHFLLLEQPEAVARAVSEFLGADKVPG